MLYIIYIYTITLIQHVIHSINNIYIYIYIQQQHLINHNLFHHIIKNNNASYCNTKHIIYCIHVSYKHIYIYIYIHIIHMYMSIV